MVGPNPSYEPPKIARPKKKYRIRFVPQEVTVEVDPAKIPYVHTGLPGSVLGTAIAHQVLLNHICGGMCSCTTCMVIVREGLKSCPPPEPAERDLLDGVPDVDPNARLACQCVPDGSHDLVVEVPTGRGHA